MIRNKCCQRHIQILEIPPSQLTISGSNAVTLDVLNGDKVAIVGVPKGLDWLCTNQMAMPGYQQISLLQLENIAAIQTLIGTLTPAVDTLVGNGGCSCESET